MPTYCALSASSAPSDWRLMRPPRHTLSDGQGPHSVAPAALHWSSGQAVQPAAVCCVPAGQALQAAPSDDHAPGAQGVQMPAPSAAAVPGAQGAPSSPSAQAWPTRHGRHWTAPLLTPSPSSAAYCVALQGVACSPSQALPAGQMLHAVLPTSVPLV